MNTLNQDEKLTCVRFLFIFHFSYQFPAYNEITEMILYITRSIRKCRILQWSETAIVIKCEISICQLSKTWNTIAVSV